MSRWRKLNQWMLDLDTFYHLYLLILLNAMYEGGVKLGCVVLGERQYIRSIGKIREDMFFKVKMRSFCKRLESKKYEYEDVFKFKPMHDFACVDYFCWMRMSVKRDVLILGLTSLIKADLGMYSCGEKHVNRVRK
ncbi:hypothetical protein [Rossellomorea vietnamensis]|uniref:hypothetical protein n=1 Tax=Rossellomorea vietnamensis TaxID=218284 RepID=UPI001E60A2E6|nr:hypothetical protein [Rossellomorea vietnamensis]MCC5801838.1 hypothetical protein [Rossellomorea vietnamensis]